MSRARKRELDFNILMAYLLSPLIKIKSPGMWFEGDGYEKKSIYSIEDGKLPPVNYDEHIFRPHSLTHMETAAHTQKDGQRIGHYYQNNMSMFYGSTLVLKLKGNHYKNLGQGVYHWVITLEQILERLHDLKLPLKSKVLITSEDCPINPEGYHNPNYVLTLSEEAAQYLVKQDEFHLYGTSWKSSDYKPGSPDRPIHNILFQKAVILENLKLQDVPEGLYFMSAFPLPLADASEAPVVPVLFSKEEIMSSF